MKNFSKPVFILLAICMIIGLLTWTALPARAESSAYSVEFTYNNLEYVLPGDTSVAMSEILTALGLAGEVTAVEISNTSLFSASRETGEWIVTALQPSSTTEWMKVTINGVTYEITVTDDNTGTITLTTALLINSGNKSSYEGRTITGTVPADQYKGIIADAHFDGAVVVDGVELNLTIDGFNVDYSEENGTLSGISFVNGATLHLTVKGENTLKAGFGGAGISVPAGCTLDITAASTGTLNAVGGKNYGGGAGIGSIGDGNNSQYYQLYNRSLGSIVINGGTINAQGGTWYNYDKAAYGAAGIGGSAMGDGTGSITINGGTVTANGNIGFGEAYDASQNVGGSVTISGKADVTASNYLKKTVHATIYDDRLTTGTTLHDARMRMEGGGLRRLKHKATLPSKRMVWEPLPSGFILLGISHGTN